ncbi:MAG: DNA-directed RNA polymerase subunit P [archaeon]|nr:DNA-directed RNA polymerase subunit P [archaeon]
MTIYSCGRKECREEISLEKLQTLPGIKCPKCGYRILYKKRPSIIKRIKAI